MKLDWTLVGGYILCFTGLVFLAKLFGATEHLGWYSIIGLVLFCIGISVILIPERSNKRIK